MDRRQRARGLIAFLRARRRRRTSADRGRPFLVLVSCVLSQRTREENTERASAQLFAVARTPGQVLALSDARLRSLIKPAGFYRQKTKTLKKLCRLLVERFGGGVPRDREALLSLPGVGPKTAAVVLSYAFGEPTIPVDVHVEVITKRLGLVPRKVRPEKAQLLLERLIPPRDRFLVNEGLVGFGREVCRTAHPRCGGCPLARICTYGGN